jgi:fatty acid desaturase
MTSRRRRALASAVGAFLVAVICAALSSNVHGGHRTVLLVITVLWLVIGGTCIANALRTAPSAGAEPETVAGDEPQ